MRKFLLLIATLFVALAAKAVDYKILSIKEDFASFTSYVVEYTSVAADGVTPIQISGVVTVPTMLLVANTDVLVVDSHHTIADNKSTPSEQGGSAGCIGKDGLGLGILFPMVSTDYVGYGITRDLVHPYLCQEQNARNSIDLIPVALDILATKYDITPKMLYNIGYSQGGGVALAVQKLIENDAQYAGIKNLFPMGIHTACGDGPYNPIVTGHDIYAKAEKVAFPAVLPMLVNGFLSGASADLTEGLKFEDFFLPALTTPSVLFNPLTQQNIEYPGLEAVVNSKEYANDDLSGVMVLAAGGKQGLADFFSKDMMDTESDLYKRFFTWLDKNDLCTGWQPEGEVLFYHLVEDDIVTVENTYKVTEALNIPEDHVFYSYAEDLGITGDNKHTQFAPTFFIDLLATIEDTYLGIENVKAELDNDAPCYDLQGRRVDANYHGIVIQRGRKYMK